jgi:hypothetical protein
MSRFVYPARQSYSGRHRYLSYIQIVSERVNYGAGIVAELRARQLTDSVLKLSRFLYEITP